MTRKDTPDNNPDELLADPEVVKNKGLSDSLERRYGDESQELTTEMQQCINAMTQAVRSYDDAKKVGKDVKRWADRIAADEKNIAESDDVSLRWLQFGIDRAKETLELVRQALSEAVKKITIKDKAKKVAGRMRGALADAPGEDPEQQLNTRIRSLLETADVNFFKPRKEEDLAKEHQRVADALKKSGFGKTFDPAVIEQVYAIAMRFKIRTGDVQQKTLLVEDCIKVLREAGVIPAAPPSRAAAVNPEQEADYVGVQPPTQKEASVATPSLAESAQPVEEEANTEVAPASGSQSVSGDGEPPNNSLSTAEGSPDDVEGEISKATICKLFDDINKETDRLPSDTEIALTREALKKNNLEGNYDDDVVWKISRAARWFEKNKDDKAEQAKQIEKCATLLGMKLKPAVVEPAVDEDAAEVTEEPASPSVTVKQGADKGDFELVLEDGATNASAQVEGTTEQPPDEVQNDPTVIVEPDIVPASEPVSDQDPGIDLDTIVQNEEEAEPKKNMKEKKNQQVIVTGNTGPVTVNITNEKKKKKKKKKKSKEENEAEDAADVPKKKKKEAAVVDDQIAAAEIEKKYKNKLLVQTKISKYRDQLDDINEGVQALFDEAKEEINSFKNSPEKDVLKQRLAVIKKQWDDAMKEAKKKAREIEDKLVATDAEAELKAMILQLDASYKALTDTITPRKNELHVLLQQCEVVKQQQEAEGDGEGEDGGHEDDDDGGHEDEGDGGHIEGVHPPHPKHDHGHENHHAPHLSTRTFHRTKTIENVRGGFRRFALGLMTGKASSHTPAHGNDGHAHDSKADHGHGKHEEKKADDKKHDDKAKHDEKKEKHDEKKNDAPKKEKAH